MNRHLHADVTAICVAVKLTGWLAGSVPGIHGASHPQPHY
jgi:hypothetical protein